MASDPWPAVVAMLLQASDPPPPAPAPTPRQRKPKAADTGALVAIITRLLDDD